MLDRLELTTVEQAKALLHPLRQKIMDNLQKGPATPSEVGRAVGVAANKAHYHVHVLEAAGLVELVEVRTVGSVTEKYYRAVAREIGGMLTPSANVNRTALLPLLEGEVRALMHDIARITRESQESGKPSGAIAALTVTEALEKNRAEVQEMIERFQASFEKAIAETPGRHLRVMVALVPTEESPQEEKPS